MKCISNLFIKLYNSLKKYYTKDGNIKFFKEKNDLNKVKTRMSCF